VGRAQPAERHRSILEHRVEREPDQVPVGVQLLHRHEHVQVRRLWRGHPDLELHPADQLGGRLEADVERGPAAATPGLFAVVGNRGGRAGPGPGQRARGRVQVQRLKRCAGHGPVVRGLPRPFMPALPDLVADPRPVADLGVPAQQEVVEERLLAPQAVGAVVVAPFLPAVRVQPFALRADPGEPLERAPGVQALIRPARHHVGRHGDLAQRRRLGRPEVVEERMRGRLGAQVLDPAGPVAPAFPDVRPEVGLRDAAVPGHLSVGVAPPLPRVDRGQVRRPGRGDRPLARGQVRDPGQAHPAVAPALRARPLDQVMPARRLLRGQERGVAAREPGSGDVGVHHRVPPRRPVRRVGGLEGRVPRQLAGRHPAVRVPLWQLRPGVLAVRRPGNQRGTGTPVGRPEHVGVDGHPAPHRHRYVPLDDHAVRPGLPPVPGRRRAPVLRAAGRRPEQVPFAHPTRMSARVRLVTRPRR
jgi:hypothetical protein